MLKGKGYEYFPKLKFIKINGFPPKEWDDLTTEDQFKEIYDIMGVEVEINSVQFDY